VSHSYSGKKVRGGMRKQLKVKEANFQKKDKNYQGKKE
jgi:hypothetical protein